MKKIIFILTFITLSVKANPYENFGEVSGRFVGTCYMLNYLKNNYCNNMVFYFPELCIDTVMDITPKNLKSEMKYLFSSNKEKFIRETKSTVDIGFQKTSMSMNSDKEKTCIAFGSMLITMNHNLLDELKRIRKTLNE